MFRRNVARPRQRAICAYRDRLLYTYTAAGRVPAQLASFSRDCAPLTAAKHAALAILVVSVASFVPRRSAPVDVPDAPAPADFLI
jgi:hypothetical protein